MPCCAWVQSGGPVVLALLYWIFRVLVLGKLPPAKAKCLLTNCMKNDGSRTDAAGYCSLGMCDDHCRAHCECLKKLVADTNN